MLSAPSPVPASTPPHDAYAAYLQQLHVYSLGLTGPLFTTDAAGLYDAYLECMHPSERPTYRCNACKRFIETYGGLVQIDERGFTRAAVWGDIATDSLHINGALHFMVNRAKVTGVFLTDAKVWGLPKTGAWTHLAIQPPKELLYKGPKTLTPDQSAAEKLEDYKMLSRALSEFNASTVNKAVTLLQSEALYRAEKCLGVAEWLSALHTSITAHRAHKANLIWRAVATAPPGFCHVRSTMIGTLLEDIASGADMEGVARRFGEKMHPAKYQRPTAPPKAGNITQAEKVIETLGVVSALARRFAKLDDIEACWCPAPTPLPLGGVFAHLRASNTQPANEGVPGTTTITWEKFARTVLPTATKIEMLVPSHGSFVAMVTAADPEAPPMLQWDREGRRNPVSWYGYTQGSSATQWKLQPGSWLPLPAIAYAPHMWGGGGFEQHGAAVMFVLPGAWDSAYTCGAGMFAESMKNEYHSIKSTLEAHLAGASIAGPKEAEVCGWTLHKGATGTREGVRLRVQTTSGVTLGYLVDRWD